MSHPANPNTLGTKMMVSTEEKVTEEKMPRGGDLHYDGRARAGLPRITMHTSVYRSLQQTSYT